MRLYPALAASCLLLLLCVNVWLQAGPTPQPIKTNVVIKGIKYEVTQNPDGSESVSLRNRPLSVAARRINTDGETEVRCLTTTDSLETFLNDGPDTINKRIHAEK